MFNVLPEHNAAASYYLVPELIIMEYREACRVDASTQWHHFMSYVSGYKNAMLAYSISPLRHDIINQLQFLYNIAMQRSNMAAHVFRRQ